MSNQEVLSPEEFYRTDDMALATFLKMQGHTPQTLRWENRTCYWYFDRSESLLGMADMFIDGLANVEPKEYSRVFALTKTEFHKVLDENRPPGERQYGRR